MSKSTIYATNLTHLANLKVIVRDAVPNIFKSINKDLKQSHNTTDFKIIVGLLSTILACITTYISVYYDFNSMYQILLVLVVSYFIINGLLESLLFLFGLNELIYKATFSKKEDLKNDNTEKAPSKLLNYTLFVHSRSTNLPDQMVLEISLASEVKNKKYQVLLSVYDLFDGTGLFLSNVLEEEITNGLKRIFDE